MKMSKRIISMLLAIVMVLGMMPTSALATGETQTDPTVVEPVTQTSQETTPAEVTPETEEPDELPPPPAEVNPAAEGDVASVTTTGDSPVTTNYTTLQSALDYAETQAGCVVKLLQNVTEVPDPDSFFGFTVDAGDFTLDLNGMSIDVGVFYAIRMLSCTMTIQDSSEGGTGTVKASSAALDIGSDSKAIILSGNYIGSYYGLSVSTASCEIHGGKFTGEVSAVDFPYYAGNLTITGGTFQSEGTDLSYSLLSGAYSGTTSISGGTFTGGLQIAATGDYASTVPTVASVLPALHYYFEGDTRLTTYASDLSTGTNDVTVKEYVVATVTTAGDSPVTTKYDGFEAAMNYAKTQSGSTVKLMQNTTSYYVQLRTPLTLDLNGFTLDMGNYSLSVGENDPGYTPHLTITDTSEGGAGKVTSALNSKTIHCGYSGSPGKVTILGGNIVNTREDDLFGAIYVVGAGTLEILGGSVQGAHSDIYIDSGSNDFTGSVTISGGTFPGGLQMKLFGDMTTTESDVLDLLAEGYGFLTEAGAVIAVADGALTTGTETVMGGKTSDCEATVTVGDTTNTYLTVDQAHTAVDAAVATGSYTHDQITLKLLKDAEVADTYLNGFTLDLNGFTLTAADTYNYAVRTDYTTEIVDSGENGTGHLKSNNSYGSAIYVAGTLIIRGGQIGSSSNLMAVDNNGTLNIYGGTFPDYVSNCRSSAVINIYGGTFNASAYNYYCDGTINVYGGTFCGYSGDVDLHHGGTANIYGGTFESSIDFFVGEDTVALNISGGTYTNGVKVSSGESADTYLAEGCVFVDGNKQVITGDALATTTVTAVSCVATVTTAGDSPVTTAYNSLQMALDYAMTQTDSVVKLMQDTRVTFNDNYGVNIPYGQFTIDLNGKTISSNVERYTVNIYGGAVITLMDSSSEKTGTISGAGYSAVYAATGDLTIQGGNYERVVFSGSGQLTIHDGVFTGENAIDIGYHTSNVTIYGGEFKGTNYDLFYNLHIDNYAAKTALSGGTFPGGLQIGVGNPNNTAPTAVGVLAEGCAYFSEAGTQVTVAEDAYTTGTETVTVGKLSDCEATVTIGETSTTYLDIDKALAAVNTAVATGNYTYEQITLKLLKDCAFGDESIVSNKGYVELNGFTLDLNGYTLKGHSTKYTSFYTAEGYTTSIRDSSTAGTGALDVGYGSYSLDGTVNVYGGSIVNSSTTGSYAVYSGGTLNVYGGKIKDSINVRDTGTLNIYGGSFTGITRLEKIYYYAGAAVTIYGGTFNGIQILEGGTAKNPEDYLAPGYVFVDENKQLITGDALETTTVTAMNCVATVTVSGGVTTVYDSLTGALDYAVTQTGSVVKLMQDCATTSDDYYGYLIRNAELELDLNGKTLSTTGSNYALYTSLNARLVIRDSSAEQTGAITQRIFLEGEIHGGSYQGVYCYKDLTIYGGTFAGDRAVSVTYNTYNLTVHGGEFNGTQCDLFFVFDTGNYVGKTAFYGGTFPGGLQITVGGQEYTDSAPTAAQILGEGYCYFNASGMAVIPAADAYTTGTETVTVEKKAALSIALNKELYYKDDGTIKVTITTQQKELSGWLYIYIDGQKIDQESYSVSGGRQPLTNGKVYTKSLFNINPGDHEIYLVFVPDDTTMAEGQSNTVAFSVGKIPNDRLTKHFTNGEFKVTYDGTVKAADVKSIYTAGANNFYVAPENYTLTYWQGETQVAEPVNVGVYTVKFTMAENDYYEAATNYELGTLTIEKANLLAEHLDYTVPADGTYNGTAYTATATMKSHLTAYGEVKVEYLKAGETERTTTAPIAPGTYTVYVSISGGENFNASEVELGSFTISKAAPSGETAIYVNGEVSYNGQYEDQIALHAVLSGSDTGAVPTGTLTVTAGGQEIGTFTLTEGKIEASLDMLGVGNYEIGYTYSGDENYDTVSGKLYSELVISPKAVILTPSGLEQTYDTTAKTISFTNNTQKLGMDDFTVTYYLVDENMGTISKVNRAVSIGRYLYVVELKDEHKTNYRFESPITIDGDTLPEGTFDNAGFMDIVAKLPEAQEPIYFVEGAVTVYLVEGTYSGNTLVNPNNTTPIYTSSNNAIAEVAADGTVTLKRTGTVTIFATSEKEGTTPVRASYTLTIEKKDATITVNGLTTTYGAPFALTAEMLTITGCELADLDLTNLTYSGYTVGQGVGTYYITPAGITSEAYDLTFVAGTLTVQPREIDASAITVTAATKIYDGTTDADLTAVLPEGAVLAGDRVTVTAEGAYTAATAGTVEATITALTLEGKDADNYVLTGTAPTTAEGEIQKATVTFTTESRTFTYDGTAKALDIVAKTNNGLTAEYTVQYSAEPIMPGTYTVTVTLTDTVNYTADVTGLEGKILKIEKAKQQSFTVSGLEDGIRYGDTKILTAEGAEGTVTFTIEEGNAATVTPSGELTAIGTGKVVILATSVKEGFEDKTVKVTVTVGKRLITASLESVTDRQYNGTAEVTATVTLNDVIENDIISVTNVAEIQTPDAGNNKSVTITLGELTGEDAGLYELTTATLRGKVNITARAIDAAAITVTAAGKIYDGTTSAVLTATVPEGAVLEGDQVTITAEGAYISANAGTTEVTVTALTLDGNDARNYVLTGTAPATALGEITKATATFTTASKTVSYDGYEKVLDINIKTNNGLTADYTVTYSTEDGKAPILPGTYTVTVTLTDTVNYTADVTGLEGKTITITAAKQQSFTVSGLEDGIRYGDTKILTADGAEGTVTFTIEEGTAATVTPSGELTAIGTGKVVILATSVKEGFEDKTVKVTVTVGKRLITAVLDTVTDRVYNGSTLVDATVKLENTVEGDDVMVTGIIAEMMTPGVGEGKTVTVTVSGLSGNTANFYELTNTTLRGTVNITPKTVEAIAFTVSDKTYDGTTDAELVNITLTGILGSDQVSATAKVSFRDANAGENKTIDLVDVTLTGADARNYWIADTTAVTVNAPTIHKALVNIFCAETTTCTYDGTAKSIYISALTNGKAFNGYTVSYMLDGVATEPVNVGTYTMVITLNDEANYQLTPYTAKLVIEPATQDEATMEGIPDRVYYGDDFTVTVPGTSGTVSYEITGAATMDENGKVTANDVGTITITATITMANYKDQVITRTFTAYPRVLTATATAANRTYNGKNDVDVTISLSNVVAGDTVTATALGQMATSDAGTDKLVYVSGITLSDSVHYTLETTTLQTTVDIARIVISSITATAQDKVYDGSDEATVTITGSSNILSGDEVTITGTGRFASANAGKHTVTVTPKTITGPKAQNYVLADGLTGTTQAEILLATVVFQVGTASFIYDGEVKTVEVTAQLNGQAFTGFTVSYDPAEPVNVGTYTVTVTLNDSGNYVGAPDAFVMEILPADQEMLVIAGMPGVVDYSRVFTLTTNAHANATVTWSTSDETIATVDENGTVTIVDVDREVTITATSSMANYHDRTATVTFTPVAKQVTFQLSDLITTYDGTVQGITVTPSVADLTDYSVTYIDEEGRAVEPLNAGTYQVEVKTTSNKYAGYTMGTFTIKKGTMAGVLTVEDWTYGEEPNAPEYTLSVEGLRPKYTYSGTGLKDGKPYGAGQYTVTATFTDRNHETLVLTADFEVEKAMLTVTTEDVTRTYGENNPSFNVSIAGYVYGETDSDLLVVPTATTTATATSDVGEYPITVSGGRSENYAFTYASGKLTVVPAEGTLTITGSSHQVTIGQELYLTAHLDGYRAKVIWSSSDESVAVIDENGKVTVVGAGSATITAKLNEKNYTADDATFLLETTQKTVSLLPKTTVFTYNGTVQGVEFLETEGFTPVVGENVKVTYTLTTDHQAVELRNAGTYVATYVIDDPAYAGSGTFTVYMNKATRTLRPADLEKTYGEANPAFTIDPNGLLGEDVTDESYITRVNAMFVFTCEATDKSVEGTYPITMALAEGHSLTEDTNYNFVIATEPGYLVIRSITGSETCPSAHFTDLNPDAWYHEAVDYVVGHGLMNGVSDTLFAPQSSATRGMIVTILYRLEGEPEMGENVFTDVAEGAWYADAIAWANANGIVLGYGDDTFRPNQAITREEMALIMYRYAAYKGCDVEVSADLSGYTDAQSISVWAKEAMAWANAAGLIQGRTETTLAPKGTATRVELATILMRLIENVLK